MAGPLGQAGVDSDQREYSPPVSGVQLLPVYFGFCQSSSLLGSEVGLGVVVNANVWISLYEEALLKQCSGAEHHLLSLTLKVLSKEQGD